MKKQLLSVLGGLMLASGMQAQFTVSPSWTVNQQAAFPTAPSSATPGIRYLDAVDQNVVWVVGYDGTAANRAYNWYSKTTNGGSSWTGGDILPDTNSFVLANLEGIDANTAWVASFTKSVQAQGAIFRTNNGGSSWQNMTASGMYTNTSSFCNIVSFLTPSVGITMGDPNNGGFEIWRTTNGGASWSQISQSNIPTPLSGEFGIVNLYCKLGTSNLWFGTNAGRMYRTADGGQTWSVGVVSSQSHTLLELAFSTPSTGITYVWNGSTVDVYNTTDGGANWNLITPTGNIGYADICGIPGTNILASFGSGTNNNFISYSGDNGLTWTDWGSVGIQYLTGDFVSNTTGWAGGFDLVPSFTNIWKYNGAALTSTVAPTSAFSMNLNLCGPSVTITPANSSVGSPAPSYSWSSVGGGVSFSSPTASAPVITFTANGTYTIQLKATNSAGNNISTQVVTVANCVAPVASFSVASVSPCGNIPFTLVNSSTGGTPAPSYQWSASSSNVTFAPSSVASNPTVVAAPGTYTVYLVATNNTGSVQTQQTVTINNCAPTVAFVAPTTMTYCNEATRKITVQNSTPTNTLVGATTYTWKVAPTTNIQMNSSFSSVNLVLTVTVPVGGTPINNYTLTLTAKNAAGTSSVAQTFSVDYNEALCQNDVGINENHLASLVQVYPNPASDVVTVKVNGAAGYTVKMVNVLGAVVYEERGIKSDAHTIQLANKPRGVYFLTIENGSEKVTRKVVVE